MEKRIQFRRNNYAQNNIGQFWVRFLAFGIDIHIAPICAIPLFLFLGEFEISENNQTDDMKIQLISVMILATLILYFTLFEQSRWRGTIGKIFMKLTVSDLNGNQLTFKKSLFRNLLKILSILTIVGVYMIDITKHKQSLHDMITGTKVSRR